MSDNQKLYIRVDGGGKIGLGHLNRCIALALIAKEDFDITFVFRFAPEYLLDKIHSYGISTLKTDDEIGWLKVLNKNDIVLLDGYDFHIDLQLRIREIAHKLIIIDDIYDRPLKADLIINYSPQAENIDYRKDGNENLALGVKYLILNQIFLAQAKVPYNKKTENYCLICMGGSDSKNYTLHALTKAISTNFASKYYVVLGPNYMFGEKIQIIAQKHPNIIIVNAPSQEEIFDLMLKCDKAICASGTLSFEYICTGGMLGIIKTADNQSNIYDYLISNGLAFDFLSEKEYLVDALQIERQKCLINGQSPANLLQKLKELQHA